MFVCLSWFRFMFAYSISLWLSNILVIFRWLFAFSTLPLFIRHTLPKHSIICYMCVCVRASASGCALFVLSHGRTHKWVRQPYSNSNGLYAYAHTHTPEWNFWEAITWNQHSVLSLSCQMHGKQHSNGWIWFSVDLFSCCCTNIWTMLTRFCRLFLPDAHRYLFICFALFGRLCPSMRSWDDLFLAHCTVLIDCILSLVKCIDMVSLLYPCSSHPSFFSCLSDCISLWICCFFAFSLSVAGLSHSLVFYLSVRSIASLLA